MTLNEAKDATKPHMIVLLWDVQSNKLTRASKKQSKHCKGRNKQETFTLVTCKTTTKAFKTVVMSYCESELYIYKSIRSLEQINRSVAAGLETEAQSRFPTLTNSRI